MEEVGGAQAFCDGKKLRVCEGVRAITHEGETVTIQTVYPDAVVVIVATKTFPPGTLAAARLKWKAQNYGQHYGNPFGDPFGQQQAYQQQMTQEEILRAMAQQQQQPPSGGLGNNYGIPDEILEFLTGKKRR